MSKLMNAKTFASSSDLVDAVRMHLPTLPTISNAGIIVMSKDALWLNCNKDNIRISRIGRVGWVYSHIGISNEVSSQFSSIEETLHSLDSKLGSSGL